MKQKYVLMVVAIVVIVVAIIFTYHYRAASGALPAEVVLQVPFSSQAPNGNWDRNEDCEETSITMANAFLTGSKEDKLPAPAAQEAINNLKKWEGANIGYNANTGAEATKKMAEGAFGLKVKQINGYTEQDLKTELAAGHPVLLQINARKLGNPKYLDNGPLYHMVVARGYNNKGIIVNDPGTEGGDGNQYTFEVLINAAADWDQVNKQMNPQNKIALAIYK